MTDNGEQEAPRLTLVVDGAEFSSAYKFISLVVPRGDNVDPLRYVAIIAEPGSGVVRLSAADLSTTLGAQVKATVLGDSPFQVAMHGRPLRLIQLSQAEARISIGSDAVSIRIPSITGSILRITRAFTTDREAFPVDYARDVPRVRIQAAYLRTAYRLLNHIVSYPTVPRTSRDGIHVIAQRGIVQFSAYDGLRFATYTASLEEEIPTPWEVALPVRDFGWNRHLSGVVVLGDAYLQQQGVTAEGVSNRRALLTDAKRSIRTVPTVGYLPVPDSTKANLNKPFLAPTVTRAIVTARKLKQAVSAIMAIIRVEASYDPNNNYPIQLTIDEQQESLTVSGSVDPPHDPNKAASGEHIIPARCRGSTTVIVNGYYLHEVLRGVLQGLTLRIRIAQIDDGRGGITQILRLDEGREKHGMGIVYTQAALQTRQQRGTGQ